jgi:TonB family protein
MRLIPNRTFLILIFIGVAGISGVSAQVGSASEPCRSYFDTLHQRQVYKFVDSMPEFAGGHDAMLKFIWRNLKWPNPHFCGEGTIYVSFIVEENGEITDVKIRKGFYKPAEEEAMRVIRKMPYWFPACCNGQPVPVLMIIPIKFSIN